MKTEQEELAKAFEFERRERAKTIKEELPPEPAAGTADVAEVVFRAQGTGKRVSRRFLKGDSIQLLYNFVRTLDEEVLGFEDPASEFQLI